MYKRLSQFDKQNKYNYIKRPVTVFVVSAFSVRADTAPNEEIQSRLYDAGNVTGTNLCMMTCANIIACVGLNAGSMTQPTLFDVIVAFVGGIAGVIGNLSML